MIVNHITKNNTSLWNILLLSLICLILAHLSLKTHFPNPIIWTLSPFIICIICSIWLIYKKDVFAFLLVIFICSHFSFAENQGGLFSYIFVGTFFAGLIFLGKQIIINSKKIPIIFHILIILLSFYQIAGLIVNPYPLVSKIQGVIIFLSWISVFYCSSASSITKENAKRFLIVLILMTSWMFIVSLNQKYHFFIIDSPLIPQRGTGKAVSGTFQNTELFAEYNAFIFMFSIIILGSYREFKLLDINRLFFLLMAFFSSCLLMMSGSRSAIILAIAGLFYIIFLNIILLPSLRNIKLALLGLLIFAFVCGLILSLGNIISLDYMQKDFKKINIAKLDTKSVLSGKGINRGNLFRLAYHRLQNKSRLLGYGYSTTEYNRTTLELKNKNLADYHSLYLSLPFFWGWGGAILFILIVLFTGLRSYFVYIKTRKFNHYLVSLSLGCALMWGIFLIDQYKIGVTRNPCYFFLIWLLLGLTHAINNMLLFNE